jgi:outer membrane protein OmpA-like peptidoglycan-associated protein
VITIEGFADPAGSTRYNMDLSKRRADAVAAYLAEKGLNTANFRTVGYGESRLVNARRRRTIRAPRRTAALCSSSRRTVRRAANDHGCASQ